MGPVLSDTFVLFHERGAAFDESVLKELCSSGDIYCRWKWLVHRGEISPGIRGRTQPTEGVTKTV